MKIKISAIFLWSIIISLDFAFAGELTDALKAIKTGKFEAAVAILKPLSEKGDANATAELGALYMVGKGVPRDAKEALRLTKLAAEKDSATAQFNLGSIYLEGQITPKDYKAAMKWFLAAAGKGLAAAQVGVATMFYNGEGVVQNYDEAAKWMILAAEQGDTDAQMNLGGMYALGQGLKRDLSRAYMWTYLATDTSIIPELEKNALREDAEKTLSTEDLAKARQMIKACKEKNFKQC